MKTPTHHIIETFVKIDKQHSQLWEKALKEVETVKIVKTTDPRLKGIAATLKRIHAKEKECYLNSIGCVMRNHEIEYVEGYLEVEGVPIEHAWNCWNGIHFDLTEEKLGTQSKYPHRKIMKCPGREALQFAMLNFQSGPYLFDWLDKK